MCNGKMRIEKLRYILVLVAALSIGTAPVDMAVGAEAPPKIDAASAILTDAVTGQILYQKNAQVRRPMASTTKIMTAIIVIENCSMDEVVTASENASKVPYTSLHLKPGEQVKVKDLLYALMIRSANDSAVALAEHVAGSVEGFAAMMNAKAKELGAKNTHFVNPNGLYAKDHYSTAYDLALITRYALKLPVFNEIITTQRVIIDRSINKQDLLISTKSKFLKNYPGADGVKSGYIKQAGYCYVGSATRGGWRLVSAVLKSNDSQADTSALMNYGFKNYQRLILAHTKQPVETIAVKGGDQELKVVPAERVHVVVKAGNQKAAKTEIKLDEISAPVKKGDKVGTLTAIVDGRPVFTVDLEAANDVDESTVSAMWPWVRTMALISMLGVGAACGRATAKSDGGSRSRFSQEV